MDVIPEIYALQKEYAQKMRDLVANDDEPESRHFNADVLLCDALETLGFNEMVAIFDSLERWYT